jgi:hypothetical protein
MPFLRGGKGSSLLITLNIPMHLVKLVQSYIMNRTFCVHIGDNKSKRQLVPAGVPQGSILGPYLFLTYINDVPIQTRTHLACFADDTASYTSSKDTDLIISRLQLSLDLLHSYFTKWKLKLNEAKTEAIIFARQRKPTDKKLKISGHAIPWSSAVRYLGVIMDSKLNWTKHTCKLRVTGAQALGALSPVLNRRSNLSPQTKLRIYTTLDRPCLTYACPVWSSTCFTNYELLQTIQNKAVKIAYKTPFKTNLKKLHISENIPLLRKFIITLTLNTHFNTMYKNSTFISAIRIFNNLPVEIKMLHGNKGSCPFLPHLSLKCTETSLSRHS